MTCTRPRATKLSTSVIAEALESRTLFALLYVCDSSGDLATIDTAQASLSTPVNFIKNTGIDWNDIAFSPQGVLYGIDNSYDTNLFRIDATTGATTYIGSLGTQVNSLAFAQSGTLYAANDSLWQINTSTGAANFVTGLGGFESAGDLALDTNGNLFLSTTAGELVTVNPATETAFDVGSITDSNVEALAYADQTLYGVDASYNALLSIDTATGQSNLLGLCPALEPITGADAVPASAAPQQPTSVSATQGEYTNQVVLTWQPASRATFYDVWRNTTNDFSTATELGSTSNAGYSDDTMQPDSTYYYWVDASSLLGTSKVASPVTGFASSNIFTLAAFAANGNPAKNASITLYDSSGNSIRTQTTDENGETVWNGVMPGFTRFILRDSAGDLWADQTINVSTGRTSANISQTEPYEANLQVFSGTSDITGGVVQLGRPVRFVLTTTNPGLVRNTVRITPILANLALNLSQPLKPITELLPPRRSATLSWSFIPRTNAQYVESVTIAALSGKVFVTTDSASNLAPFTAGDPHLMVQADDTGAFGLATGSAIPTQSKPLAAQLTITSSLDLWLDVKAVSSAGVVHLRHGNGISGYLAGHNLMSPAGQIEYLAQFPQASDSVTVSMMFDTHSLLYTIVDYLALKQA
jgi:hypothetical protein